jgi:hypothetical protein
MQQNENPNTQNSYNQQFGVENRDNPSDQLAKSLADLKRVKETIEDPEKDKKKDPVPESMKPDQGSKTIMKIIAMALLIIGAVALGPGIGAAILGTLAGGAGLLAANDLVSGAGKSPLQSKKSKRSEEKSDKIHDVEQAALQAALASVKKNVEQINAPQMPGPVTHAESKPIPTGSRVLTKQEIDDMMKGAAAEALRQRDNEQRQSQQANSSNSTRDVSPLSPSDRRDVNVDALTNLLSDPKLRNSIIDIVRNIESGGGNEIRGREEERGRAQSASPQGRDRRQTRENPGGYSSDDGRSDSGYSGPESQREGFELASRKDPSRQAPGSREPIKSSVSRAQRSPAPVEYQRGGTSEIKPPATTQAQLTRSGSGVPRR